MGLFRNKPSGKNSWPFDQAPNVAAITLRRIVLPAKGASPRPILYVIHEPDDHSWTFLDGDAVTSADAAIVGMGEMLRHDPTIAEIADLPPGWEANRTKVGAPWIRSKRPEDH